MNQKKIIFLFFLFSISLLFGKAMTWESVSSGKISHEFMLAQSSTENLEEVLSGFDEEEKDPDSVKKNVL